MSPSIILHQSTKSIFVAYSERELTFDVWGARTNIRIGGDNVGLNKSTKAPKSICPQIWAN